MFFIFALAVMVLAFIGLGTLFGSAVGFLFLLPILLLKVAFIMFLFGFIGRSFAHRSRRPRDWGEAPWRGRPRRERRPERTDEDKFEQWHREQHAREEVDSWVEDIVGPE